MHRATTGLTDDPKPWRDRAHEARIRAGELNDPEAKRQMLGIARGYDRLAERAEERLRPARCGGARDRFRRGALDDLQSALKALYGSLADDQKARLVRTFAGLDTSRSGVAALDSSQRSRFNDAV